MTLTVVEMFNFMWAQYGMRFMGAIIAGISFFFIRQISSLVLLFGMLSIAAFFFLHAVMFLYIGLLGIGAGFFLKSIGV